MPQLFISNIKGLIPLLDRKKLQEPYVVAGANFIMEADGPVSSFGRKLVAHKVLLNPANVQTFDISETRESFIFDNNGVYLLDTETSNLFLLYKLNYPVTSEYPWTKSSVGNKYYFARKGYPLLQYDIYTNEWFEITAGIPDNIYACTESEGRLVLLTEFFSAWSAIGDGTDFVASTTTGAGAQVLTKMGLSNPIPISVQKIPDGFLTFLSSGIMRSQAIQAQNPYRHRILSYEHVPVNPYAITKTSADQIIFLTSSGFYSTDGRTPQSWQAVMGEYFHTKVLPRFDFIANQNSIQLHIDVDKAWFLIFVAENQKNYSYSKAFILNLKTDQWGSFNDPFVYMANIKSTNPEGSGFNFNLITQDGSVYKIDKSPGIQKIPAFEEGVFYKSVRADMPVRRAESVSYFPFEMQMDFISFNQINKTSLYDRYFPKDKYLSPIALNIVEDAARLDTGITYFPLTTITGLAFRELSLSILPVDFSPLDAFVHVGLIRLTDQEDNTRYSYITKANVSMLESAVGDTFVDWMDEGQFPGNIIDDWESYDGYEDWGVGAVDSVQYSFKLTSTLDGYKAIDDLNTKAEIVKIDGRTRFYAVDTMGIYHILEITANAPGDNFDLKLLDLATNLGGIL